LLVIYFMPEQFQGSCFFALKNGILFFKANREAYTLNP
jgi:hypothetical protein